MGQRGNHLLKQSKFATRSGPTPPNLIHPPQLKPLLLHSSSVNKTNLRAVINAADPVQRRCIPAQATVQQAGRQAGRPRPRPSTPLTYYYTDPPRPPSLLQPATQNTSKTNPRQTTCLPHRQHRVRVGFVLLGPPPAARVN